MATGVARPRTGTADHQHGDSPRQGKSYRSVQDDQPDKCHHQGDGDDRRHEDAGDGVRKFCDRCLGGRRVADHLNDLGQRTVLSDPGRLTAQETGLVEGRGGHLIAGLFVYRNTFTRQRRLVDRARSLQDDTVHGYIFTRANDKDIPFSDIVDAHFLFLSVPDHRRCFGRQLHQALEGVRRPALGPGFQHLADRDQSQNHGRGLKVKLHHVL